MKYLAEQHSLQVVPGALSLIGYLTGANREFRGVAHGRTGDHLRNDRSRTDTSPPPDSIHSGSWRSASGYSATCQVTGGRQ
jgi:hypothetical protein